MNTSVSASFSDSSVEVRGTTPYTYTLTEKLLSELLASFGSRLGSPIAPRNGQQLDVSAVLVRRFWEGGTFSGDLQYYRLAHPDVVRAAELLAVRPQPVQMVIEALTDPRQFVECVLMERTGLSVDVHLHLGVLTEVRVWMQHKIACAAVLLEKALGASSYISMTTLSTDGRTNLLPELKRLSGKPLDRPEYAAIFLRESFASLFQPGGDSTEKPQEEVLAASSI